MEIQPKILYVDLIRVDHFRIHFSFFFLRKISMVRAYSRYVLLLNAAELRLYKYNSSQMPWMIRSKAIRLKIRRCRSHCRLLSAASGDVGGIY